jgi:hypothetical protein
VRVRDVDLDTIADADLGHGPAWSVEGNVHLTFLSACAGADVAGDAAGLAVPDLAALVDEDDCAAVEDGFASACLG